MTFRLDKDCNVLDGPMLTVRYGTMSTATA
jgi:hypothetical protein